MSEGVAIEPPEEVDDELDEFTEELQVKTFDHLDLTTEEVNLQELDGMIIDSLGKYCTNKRL
jgi:hypothetical protein